MSHRVLLLGAFAVAIAVCAAEPTAAKKRRRGTGYEGPDPCARLTPALLTQALGKAPKEEIKSQRGRFAKEVCMLSWRKENAAQIEADMQKKMLAVMQARIKAQQEGREPPPLDLPRFENEISLTYSRQLYPTRKAARAAFDAALRALNTGVSGSATVKGAGGKERTVSHTFQADTEPVKGVGDAAAWAPRLSQLAILDGKGYFFVAARTGTPEQNESFAIKLARLLISGKGGRP